VPFWRTGGLVVLGCGCGWEASGDDEGASCGSATCMMLGNTNSSRSS